MKNMLLSTLLLFSTNAITHIALNSVQLAPCTTSHNIDITKEQLLQFLDAISADTVLAKAQEYKNNGYSGIKIRHQNGILITTFAD